MTFHHSAAVRLASIAILLVLHVGGPSAATVPSGFVETIATSGLTTPTAMEFAPDGRLFVCEQSGTLRVIKSGILLAQPFTTVAVTSTGERGLLGVAFDPEFATNNFVYVYYTSNAALNRVSRFTASGDVAVPGSELVIFEIDEAPAPSNHNGGAIHFGSDGKLFVAVGDYAIGANAQSLSVLAGKMLRINSDGTIPADNPFTGSTSGKHRAIWALGLRNPFTFGFNRATGRMFINDVGSISFEEIDDGIAGSNYGWPVTEGYTDDVRFRSPLFAYARGGNPFNCAIVGGAFYDPQTSRFPSEYVGDYFFADLCSGVIRRYKPSTGAVQEFARGAQQIVDMKVSAGGALYYLSRAQGAVYRVDYAPTTSERITIGLGAFSGDAGRMAMHAGRDGGFAGLGASQVPWSSYTNGGGAARVAMGDVDGDGLDEIVVGLSSGGAGWIAVLDDAAHGYTLLRWLQVPWERYNASNGEVFPAVGNLDGDAGEEIVAGLGSGSNGWFAVFDDAASGYALTAWRQLDWQTYNGANGTTHPAIGDLDGDGYQEIVLGLGSGSSGWMAIVDGAASGFAHRRFIQVHWPNYVATGNGTWPAVGDVDSDGRGEIVVGLGPGGDGYVEIIDDARGGFANLSWVQLAWPGYNAAIGETHPATGNLDGDAGDEIVVGHAATSSEGGWVEIFDDGAVAYARLGWRNAGWAPARTGGAATFPAVGRMR